MCRIFYGNIENKRRLIGRALSLAKIYGGVNSKVKWFPHFSIVPHFDGKITTNSIFDLNIETRLIAFAQLVLNFV